MAGGELLDPLARQRPGHPIFKKEGRETPRAAYW
jgi:hypothetical protein